MPIIGFAPNSWDGVCMCMRVRWGWVAKGNGYKMKYWYSAPFSEPLSFTSQIIVMFSGGIRKKSLIINSFMTEVPVPDLLCKLMDCYLYDRYLRHEDKGFKRRNISNKWRRAMPEQLIQPDDNPWTGGGVRVQSSLTGAKGHVKDTVPFQWSSSEWLSSC